MTMTSMTKKNYEAIAECLSWYVNRSYITEAIAHRLADYFEQDNPNFDRTRFLQACGVKTNN